MTRHATRFAGRRRRNNGRAGAARRGALSLSLCVPRRPGGRKVGRRAIPIPTSRNPFACMPRAAPPTGSSEAIRPVRLLSSLPRVQPTDRTSEGRRPCRDPFSRFPKDNTDRLSVSLSLSFHPWCCCRSCRWWWWWWVLTPPSPTRRALPLTASPFPKRSAGSLQTIPPPPLTHRRACATEEEGLALEEHVPGPRNPSWELAGAMFGVTRGRKRHRGSRRGRERGGALLCRPPPRPASLFRVFQVQILNSSSKIQQVFRSKWARREREREREGGSCARCVGRGEGKRHRLGERRGAARKIEPGRGRGGGL